MNKKFKIILFITLVTNFSLNALKIYHPTLEKKIKIYNDDIKPQINNDLILVKTELVEINIISKKSIKYGDVITGLHIHTTLYGDIDLHRKYNQEAVLIDIITNPYFLRLFRINQYGLSVYSNHNKNLFKRRGFYKYTRGDHSINMAIILAHFHRPKNEIISALLHDYTHTKCSHLGDALLTKLIEENYEHDIIKKIKYLIDNTSYKTTAIQDMIFEWYFNETGLTKILNAYNIRIEEILIENNPVIKQRSPNLCADNLEYTLTGGFLSELFNSDTIFDIISSLEITDENKWGFKDSKISIAKNFALISIELDRINSAAPWNAIMNFYGAILFENALKLNILTIEDLVFAPNINDEEIWLKIKNTKSDIIHSLIKKIEKPSKIFRFLKKGNKKSVIIKTKTRAIDPFILNEKKYLSKINQKIKEQFELHINKFTKKGFPIKFLNAKDNIDNRILIRGY
ncbi:MAG: hypothetical protein ABIF12_02880 [bacterium]